MTLQSAFDFFVETAAMIFVLLALGSLGTLLCRQPVRRMQIIVTTLAACVALPAVALLPGLPRWGRGPWIVDSGSWIEIGGWSLGGDRELPVAEVESRIEEPRIASETSHHDPESWNVALASAIVDRDAVFESDRETASHSQPDESDPPTMTSISTSQFAIIR
jgi:hypothetical protein